MRARLHIASRKLASLPVIRWRFWKDSPLSPFAWRFWHDPRWRRTALLNIATWVAGTKVIFHFAHWGPGWIVIFSVGILGDTLTWILKRAIVWARRSVVIPESVGRSWVLWALFAGVNFVLVITLNVAGDLNTHSTRYATIPFGVIINPARYYLDKEVIFGKMSLPELGNLAWNRTEREATFAYLYVRGWTGTLCR